MASIRRVPGQLDHHPAILLLVLLGRIRQFEGFPLADGGHMDAERLGDVIRHGLGASQ